jgi:hypothetical protein
MTTFICNGNFKRELNIGTSILFSLSIRISELVQRVTQRKMQNRNFCQHISVKTAGNSIKPVLVKVAVRGIDH